LQKSHGTLLFYKENFKTFPLLSQLAKAIFCMLPALIAAERLFRSSGRIVTTERISLLAFIILHVFTKAFIILNV
jgi:hypothetical protein